MRYQSFWTSIIVGIVGFIPLSAKVNKSTTVNIQVAILFDTSNSMDGLINQAKSRLWNVVNTLTTLRYNGKAPNIEIALYEYGNDWIPSNKNYIRQVVPFSTDLDLLSEKLFSLRTNGGSEYCGAVIGDALHNLRWQDGKSDMKLIYIAGNEPFDQGPISCKETIREARRNNIFVNTILCGDRDRDEISGWKDGARLGEGEFFIINADKKIIYIETPYDSEIDRLNINLNGTYMGYGNLGKTKKEIQHMQDMNAATLSMSNKIERAVAKSKSIYKNTDWDIIDQYKLNPDIFLTISDTDLPDALKGKNIEDKKSIVKKNIEEREKTSAQINELSAKRQQYIEAKSKLEGRTNDDDLGWAIESSILKIAGSLGYNQMKSP
ncbi:MAG: VWA domain-containing protein [Saprospiraceae bacterium]|nr:VWA domain-containing protein [Saprospiraceae bacterium]MBL0025009.1 VWA domain-containing protein [Saprospiraceae bacterium]